MVQPPPDPPTCDSATGRLAGSDGLTLLRQLRSIGVVSHRRVVKECLEVGEPPLFVLSPLRPARAA